MVNNEFAGLNGFVWWIGVVEDRTDPLKLGRCRVRIAGWHSEKVTELPTDHLPWAQAMMPVNNPNTYTPKESDMVVGFFLDGENAQQPIIMGVLPGIPLVNSNEKTGFGDTRTSKQIDIAPAKPGQNKTAYPRYLDEPTTSRLARNEQPTQIDLLKQLSIIDFIDNKDFTNFIKSLNNNHNILVIEDKNKSLIIGLSHISLRMINCNLYIGHNLGKTI